MSTAPDIFGVADETDEPPYVILQTMPAEGWRAVFAGSPIRLLGLACFALVEIVQEAALPQRGVRPMVVTETGDIDDVDSFEDFVCLIPPGTASIDIQSYVTAAQAARDDNE